MSTTRIFDPIVEFVDAKPAAGVGRLGLRGPHVWPAAARRLVLATLVWAALGLGLMSLRAVGAASGATAADVEMVFRYDPAQQQLVPVPAEQQTVGRIYRRFHPHLQRWVWSFCQGRGQFSFALGEGTIQPAQNLDLRLTPEETEEAILRVAPTLTDAIKQHGGRVYVKLNHEDQWELYGPFGVPSALDAETGRRWENHGSRYVPVSHINGYRWQVRDGRYVPQSTFWSGSSAWPAFASPNCHCGD